MNTSLKKYLFSYLLVISCFAHLNSDGQVLSFNNSDLKSMSIVKDSSKKSYLLLFCKKTLRTGSYSKATSLAHTMGKRKLALPSP
jgi:hypothetical protein